MVEQFEFDEGGFLGERGRMVPDTRGEWVRYSDYAALSDKLAEAEREIDRLKNLLGDPEGTIAHADAIVARAEAAESRVAELEKALQPFSDAVFNDNGDVSVNTAFADYDDYVRAYFVLKMKEKKDGQ